MSYYVRPMCRGDVVQVSEIDREAFPTLWPPCNYEHELRNPLAHYVVACSEGEMVKETNEAGFSRLASRMKQWFNRDHHSSSEQHPSSRQYVVGFAGFWIMAEEAHIANIAVREACRCRGIGEGLLIALIDLATKLDARCITLEVRASNIIAQNLYRKYGFVQVGLRHGYYADNREDGLLMSTESITSASFQTRFQRLKQVYSGRWAVPVEKLVGALPS